MAAGAGGLLPENWPSQDVSFVECEREESSPWRDPGTRRSRAPAHDGAPQVASEYHRSSVTGPVFDARF